MDWTQAFTIIGIIAGFFIFMMNRMDSNQKQMNEHFNTLENYVLPKKFIQEEVKEN